MIYFFLQVDESQQEDEKLKKLKELANIKTNFGKYKLVPVPVQGFSGKSMNSKSAAVLAAVGAGIRPIFFFVILCAGTDRDRNSN